MGSASSEMASSDLLWALTRKTNAFLVKRNGLQLTSEPNNLMGKHCFKYSGLANEEAVGIEECPRGITRRRTRRTPWHLRGQFAALISRRTSARLPRRSRTPPRAHTTERTCRRLP